MFYRFVRKNNIPSLYFSFILLGIVKGCEISVEPVCGGGGGGGGGGSVVVVVVGGRGMMDGDGVKVSVSYVILGGESSM